MRKYRFLMVLLVVVSGCLLGSDNPKTAKRTPRAYFPLSVGRCWKYAGTESTANLDKVVWRAVTRTTTFFDTLVIYTIHECTTWNDSSDGPKSSAYRYRGSSVEIGAIAYMVLREPLTAGESWTNNIGGQEYFGHITDVDVTITTPAGKFTEVLRVESSIGKTDDPRIRYYAPGVGVGVVWYGSDSESFELMEYGTSFPPDLPDVFDKYISSTS
jgi:hypothetical protein